MKFAEKVAFYTSPMGKLRVLLHLRNLIKLYWRVFTDKRVSLVPKIILVAGIIYAIVPYHLPLDAIPGFLEVDDVLVLFLACKAFMALAPRTVVEEHVRLIDEGA